MPRLHHAATSVCSQKVRVVLAEKGMAFDSVLLDLMKGEQFDPAYLALNPRAVVPTLVDGDFVLTESSVICQYLDRIGGGRALMPADPRAEARTRHWLQRTLEIHAAVNTVSFAMVLRHRATAGKTEAEVAAMLDRIPDPIQRDKRADLLRNGPASRHMGSAHKTLAAMVADMERALSEGGWLTGPDHGLADAGLIAYVDRLDRLALDFLWQDAPGVAAWLATSRARPSFAAAFTDWESPEAIASLHDQALKALPQVRAHWAEPLTA